MPWQWMKYPVKPDGGVGRSIIDEKANSYAEYVTIPVKINLCPLHDTGGPV